LCFRAAKRTRHTTHQTTENGTCSCCPSNTTANVALYISAQRGDVLRSASTTFFDSFLGCFTPARAKDARDRLTRDTLREQGLFRTRQSSHGRSRNTATHNTSKTTSIRRKLLTRLFWRHGCKKLLVCRALLQRCCWQIHHILVSLAGDFTALQTSPRCYGSGNTSPLTSFSGGSLTTGNGSATSDLTSSSCDSTNTKRCKKLRDLLNRHRRKQTRVLS